MKILEEIKAHPYITTAIVVGGIGLIYAATANKGGTTVIAGPSGPSDAVQIAGIQAAAATSIASAQSQDSQSKLTAQTKVALATLDTQLSEQHLQASTAQTINSQNLTAAITTQAATQKATTQNQATLYATQLINNTISNPNTSSGTSPTTVVDALYESVLGRAPDAQGLAYWTGIASRDEALGVSTQEETARLLAAFQNSQEYQNKLVAA